MPATCRAAGVDIEQFRRDVADALRCLASRAIPLVAAQLVQRRPFGRGAGIAADPFERGDRHIQLVAAGIGQRQVLVFDAAGREPLQPQIAADAVFLVYYRGIELQVGEVAHDAGRVARRLAPPHLARALAEQQRFRHYGQWRMVQHQAQFQWRDRDRQHLPGGHEGRPVVQHGWMDAEAGQLIAQRLAAPGGFRGDEDATGKAVDEGSQCAGRLFAARPDFQVARQMRIEAHAAVLQQHFLEQSDLYAGIGGQPGLQFVGPEKQRLRRQDGALAVMAARLVAFLQLFLKGGSGPVGGIQLHNAAVRGQVVEQRGRLLKEQRQVVFGTGRRVALADLAVDVAVLRITLEAGAEALPEQAYRGLVQGELARRQQTDFVAAVERALRLGIEGADGLDFVVEQVDAERLAAAHREQVEQGTAYRELAVFHDLGDAAVAGGIEPCAHGVEVEPVAAFQQQAVALDEITRRQALQQGGGGDDQQAPRERWQPVQRGQALGDDVLVR